MLAEVCVGTASGLFRLPVGAPGDARPAASARDRAGSRVTALAGGGRGLWALATGSTLLQAADGRWEAVAEVPGNAGTCIGVAGGEVLVGTAEAGLLRLRGGAVEPVASFDKAPERDAWYTPWGGPPDTRSISAAPDGTLYVNVHVGGILRSRDGGGSWEPTIDVDADVHQVLAHPDMPGVVLAAAAVGLAWSRDGGASWTVEKDGLHASYARAIAVSGSTTFLTASMGPRAGRAAVYRRALDGGVFERCREGLPDWFSSNIDTGCLAAAGDLVVFGTEEGSVFASADGGETWRPVADGLPEITAVVIA